MFLPPPPRHRPSLWLLSAALLALGLMLSDVCNRSGGQQQEANAGHLGEWFQGGLYRAG